MRNDYDNEDVKLYLNEDEIERIIYLLDNVTKKESGDKRLLRILLTQLSKHKERKGGTNG